MLHEVADTPRRALNPSGRVVSMYPARQREALVAAAHRGDHGAIDAITDALALMGFCRPRNGCSTRPDPHALLDAALTASRLHDPAAVGRLTSRLLVSIQAEGARIA